MGRYRTEALLLRAVDFGESDRIVRMLTPHHGRLTAIAKGARRSVRRFPGSIDLFNHVVVRVEQRRPTSMPRLEEARLRTPFLGLRRDFRRFALACTLFELLDRLAPEGGQPGDARRLFAFASESLRWLEGEQPDARARVLLELRAFAALGLRPELRRCVECGRDVDEPRVAFHVPDGGVLCGACRARREGWMSLGLGTLRLLERGLEFPLDHIARLRFPQGSLAEATQLVERFGRFHLGIELRSEPILARALESTRSEVSV